MKANEAFEQLIRGVLKAQDYSEDLQNISYDDVAHDDSVPPELREFMHAAGQMWEYLMENAVYLEKPEPVLASNQLVVTPTDTQHITDWIEGIPQEHRGAATIAVQMTINYINAKS